MRKVSKDFHKFFLFFIFCLFCFSIRAQAQVRVPFSERASQSNPSRKTYNIKGDFALIGNTNLSLENYSDNLMNDNMLLFVDIDSNPNTINSSAATLLFPSENGSESECTNVLFAGLYWSGRGPVSDVFYVEDDQGMPKKLDRKEVTLFGPNDTVGSKFRAGENDIRYTYGLDLDNDLGLFVGFVEVTDYVREHGEGEYIVADLGALEGTNYHYGGWSMVVVYENPVMENRAITVFDGYAFVRGSVVADFTIPIEGFSAIDTGPVNMKIGVASGEGDVAAFGDYFEIEQGINSNNFVKLSHEGNSLFNFFNSSISTGGNPRRPNLKNNTGMDISVFDIPNVGNSIISNGQTSTRFRYGTDGDAYVIYNIVMAVDSNEPKVTGYHFIDQVNSASFTGENEFIPEDELELVVEVRNTGGVDLKNVELVLDLPIGLEYINSKGEYFFANNSGNQPQLNADQLVWKIGDLPVPPNPNDIVAKLTYSVKITDSCSILLQSCGGNFVIDGKVDGISSLTGIRIPTSSLIVDFSEDENCFNSPIFGPINLTIDADDFLQNSCGYQLGEAKIKVCVGPEMTEIPTSFVEDLFPLGTKYYSEYPLTSETIEYFNEVNFPIDFEAVFYAVKPDSSCPIGFGFKQSEVSAVINVEAGSCEDGSAERVVNLDIVGGMPPYSIFWDDENSETIEASKSLPPGLHYVRILDQTGCEKRFEVEVPESTSFSLNVDKIHSPEICPENPQGSILLTMRSSTADIYDIKLAGVLNSGEIFELVRNDYNEQSLGFENLLPGTYTVSVTNEVGCAQVEYFELNEADAGFLTAEFEYTSQSGSQDNSLYYEFPILFENLSSGSAIKSYVWDFGDGITSTDKSPTHTYQGPGEYTVNLEVTNEIGCSKIYTENLVVIGSRFLRMPTAFSPNGDGKNDFYFPVFSQMRTIKLWLFNRWGEIIYYSEKLDNAGWDGSLNGKDAPNGTYIYRVEYTDSSEQAKTITQSGNFLLIR